MERRQNDVSWKIGGEAGFGIMSTGATFAKTCMRAGLHVVEYAEYPSLIRGGHNTDHVTARSHEVWAHRWSVDILIALNKETIDRHIDEVSVGGVVLYDTTDRTFRHFDPTTVSRSDVRLIGLPLEELALKGGGQKLMRNSVALGATCALLSLDFELPAAVIHDTFADKGSEITTVNVNVLRAGYEAVTPEQVKNFPWDLVPQSATTPHMLLTGNDAIGLGALQAGCSFYAAYPMTPASSILHFMAEHGPKRGVVVRHAEDEIGVINETIGAAYAGVRAMCATSGGGFALMTEAVGLAGMTEVGIVIAEAQRGGPSTGLPTWTEQGDLRQVIHASQGDFLKIVIAPGDQSQAFTLTQQAFDLAERYQTPVIIMTDKHLAEGHMSVPTFTGRRGAIDRGAVMTSGDAHDANAFRRYRTDGEDGISPRSLPGTPNGLFLANSDEHDEYGYSNEEASNRLAQMDKRARKTAAVVRHLPAPTLVGPADAAVTLVTWGSTVGACREAVRLLHERHHIEANILQILYLCPLPGRALAELLSSAKVPLVVEANHSGQLEGLLRQETGFTFAHRLRRYDGRPFDPENIVKSILDIVG